MRGGEARGSRGVDRGGRRQLKAPAAELTQRVAWLRAADVHRSPLAGLLQAPARSWLCSEHMRHSGGRVALRRRRGEEARGWHGGGVSAAQRCPFARPPLVGALPARASFSIASVTVLGLFYAHLCVL